MIDCGRCKQYGIVITPFWQGEEIEQHLFKEGWVCHMEYGWICPNCKQELEEEYIERLRTT